MSPTRFLVIIVALVVAIASAIVVLPVAALVDPVTRSASANLTIAALFAVVGRAASEPAPGQALATMIDVIGSVTMMICALPILVVGLIGETAKVASWIWYSVATGVVAAAIPFVLRAKASGQAVTTPVEARFALVFFLTGVVSGLSYWLVAGRTANQNFAPSRRPPHSV